MDEKRAHYRSVLIDVVFCLVAGAVAVGFNRLRDGPFWFDVCTAVFFVGLATAVASSPRVRRYMRMQYPGGNQRPDPDIVGKYTILEAELDEIRADCLGKLRLERPHIALVAWGQPAWEAIRLEHHYAIIPATLDDVIEVTHDDDSATPATGHVQLSGCFVAIWSVDQWTTTPMFWPGGIEECKEFLRKQSNDAPRHSG